MIMIHHQFEPFPQPPKRISNSPFKLYCFGVLYNMHLVGMGDTIALSK